MKRKIGLGFLLLLELFVIINVYLIRGSLSPYLWVGSVFILAPLASIALIVQIIVIITRLLKKKSVKWIICYTIVTIILAYPITILFGCSILTYPTSDKSKEAALVMNPIQDSIVFGGKEYKTHAVWPSECYAYDILKEPYDIGSDCLEEYGIYLADVYSPVDGTIIGAYDNEEDIKPGLETFKSSLGNYIYIKIDGLNTYMILAHLEKDSITVEVGDHVKKGNLIAKVGNSGTTSEPHLHMQHQKNDPRHTKLPVCAQGLPIILSR